MSVSRTQYVRRLSGLEIWEIRKVGIVDTRLEIWCAERPSRLKTQFVGSLSVSVIRYVYVGNSQ